MEPASAIVTFSIVSAVYDVARYLPDFIASIEAQTRPLDDVEIIMIDDGSTDESLSLLRAWQERRPDLVTVLERVKNGGQAAARNDGLKHAHGAWVTFADPDDELDPDYLAKVSAALKRWPGANLIATNRIILEDKTGELLDQHATRGLFKHRDQLKDLDLFPEFFHNAANAAFMRRDLIEEHGLAFDPRIRPNFEDGHLIQRYLLRCDQRTVAFVRSARYLYRRRADRSSTIQRGPMDPRRFSNVPRHGYLELLEEGASRNGGRPPLWLQHMIIYELSFFISPEDALKGNATVCHGEIAEEFISLLRQIRRLLDDTAIADFITRPLRPEWFQVLTYGLIDDPWHSDVVFHRYDKKKQEVLFSYRWTGPEPSLQILLRGVAVEPVATKVRGWTYFDHILLRERMVWVSAAGTLAVHLDGLPAALQTSWARPPRLQIRPAALQDLFGARRVPGKRTKPRRRVRDRIVRRVARSRPVRRRFSGAWVLMDRVNLADDNAEVLYRHLRAEHPDVNAWFVIDRNAPDGKRARQDLGRRRVIHYGGFRWTLLMLNAEHLVSSHAEVPIISPKPIRDLAPIAWKTTFLQHGVIQSDLSAWLNPKDIDLFITTTADEHASIVDDDTRWRFTDKEVRRTGLPRYDDLWRRGRQVPHDDRDLVLIAPTWRDWLNEPNRPGEVTRDVAPDYAESEHAHNWLGLVWSQELQDACAERGLRLGFLPHPNLQAVLPTLSLPPHVEPLTFENVRDTFAHTATVVTDYSSMAFDIAFLERPVVYFQFDRERVAAGGHMGRFGYFDHRRDGFGPVTTTLDQAVAAVIESLEARGELQSPYVDRAAKAFAFVRDGRCCERVVAAIESL